MLDGHSANAVRCLLIIVRRFYGVSANILWYSAKIIIIFALCDIVFEAMKYSKYIHRNSEVI